MMELDTFEDISFGVGMKEGFCSSESVYDSDISETDTDSKADDYDDEDSWFEFQGIYKSMNEVIKEEIDGEISLCSAKHVKNLGAVDRVETRSCITYLCGSNFWKYQTSFQPAESLEHANYL